MNTADASTATKIWRWNLSGLGYSSTGYNGTYKTAITQDGHIVADFVDTGTLTANIIKAGIMQSTNGEFSFNLESGHIEASDINITGGNINLDGGTLSVLNNDGYKADLSGGVLDLYQGAGTGTGTGEKYLTFGSSMLYKTALGGDWYATIAAPEFTLNEQSSKGFRLGASTANASAEKPAVGGLAYSWDTDYMLVEKEKTRIRRCVETNESLENRFAGLSHHRKIGDVEYIAGFGIDEVDGNPSAAMELSSVTGVRVARLDVYSAATDRVSLRLEGQGGYTTHLMVNNGVLYVGGREVAFA